MPINPIDYKSMYPKINEVSKTKNDENAKNNALIQQQANQTNKDVEKKLVKIKEKEKTNELRLKNEEKKNNKKNSKNKDKKKKNDDNESVIDIKI